ncbi:hypothetical protein [Bacillus paramycoides]
MGLALVKRLVEEQQGVIKIDKNKRQNGREVEIVFPLYDNREDQT